MTTVALIGAGTAIFLAGILRGLTGFGYALAAVPLASLFMPPRVVVAAVLVMQTAIGLRDCVREMPRADRGVVLRLAGGAVLGTPFGVAALVFLPQPAIRLALGMVVAVAVLASWRPARVDRPGSTRLALAAGVVSGVCNGLAGMAGPAAILYLLTFERQPAVIRSSLMAYFPIASLAALPMAYASGLLTATPVWLAAAGLPLMIIGGWIGTAGFRRAGGRVQRPIALASLTVTAVLSIVRGLADLL